jgi:hypothetical protein
MIGPLKRPTFTATAHADYTARNTVPAEFVNVIKDKALYWNNDGNFGRFSENKGPEIPVRSLQLTRHNHDMSLTCLQTLRSTRTLRYA